MLTFKSVNVKSSARLRKYYKNCSYRLCEYSVGVKLMWRHHMDPSFAEAGGCLIIRNAYHGSVSFDYPVPLNDSADLSAALDEIDAYCREHGVLPSFQTVPEEALPVLLHRYPYTTVTNSRTWQDYLYSAQDLASFSGRRYSGQRNHINKFRKNYPAAVFRLDGKVAERGMGTLVGLAENLHVDQLSVAGKPHAAGADSAEGKGNLPGVFAPVDKIAHASHPPIAARRPPLARRGPVFLST